MGHSPVDHAARALAALPSMFGPRVRAVVLGCALYLQDVEEDLLVLLHGRHWPPTGAWLDHWGQKLGHERRGLSDPQYLRVLDGQRMANASSGTRDQQIAVARALFPSAAITRRDLHPIAAYWEIGPLLPSSFEGSPWPSDAFLDAAGEVLRSSKPRGRSYIIIAHVEGYFGFDDDPDALGFDEGDLSEVI